MVTSTRWDNQKKILCHQRRKKKILKLFFGAAVYAFTH